MIALLLAPRALLTYTPFMRTMFDIPPPALGDGLLISWMLPGHVLSEGREMGDAKAGVVRTADETRKERR